MPFVPVLNTVMVEIRMLWDAQRVENTLYFQSGSPPEPGAMATLGNNIIAWWLENIAPLTYNGVVVREVVVTDLTTAIGPQVTQVPLTPLLGLVADESVPNNVSLAVSFRTANRGRSFRGRNYFVGLTDGFVSHNNVISTFADDVVAAYDLLDGPPFAPTWTWSVVSRYFGVDPVTGVPVPRAAGVITPITTVLITDLTVDTQRRRLPGRGN